MSQMWALERVVLGFNMGQAGPLGQFHRPNPALIISIGLAQ